MSKISELRKKYGYSQQKLAKILNVHQTAISQWETGRTTPDIETAMAMARLFQVNVEYLLDEECETQEKRNGVVIPVLGTVPAGIPIEAIEEILDYEEITEDMAKNGSYIGLRIKGDSMTPAICDGDTVIVRLQEDVESGETAIVMINGAMRPVKRSLNTKAA